MQGLLWLKSKPCWWQRTRSWYIKWHLSGIEWHSPHALPELGKRRQKCEHLRCWRLGNLLGKQDNTWPFRKQACLYNLLRWFVWWINLTVRKSWNMSSHANTEWLLYISIWQRTLQRTVDHGLWWKSESLPYNKECPHNHGVSQTLD